MPRYMFTMGQAHVHSINGKTIDKDTVAVIQAHTHKEAREIAHVMFEGEFSNSYSEEVWEHSGYIKYFPKGYVEL